MNWRRSASAALLAALIACGPAILSAHAATIIAIVNDQPITELDLKQRIALLEVMDDVPRGGMDDRKALRQLIDQTVKIQEAKRYNLLPSDTELNERIKVLAKNMKLTVDQLYAKLEEKGVSRTAFIEYVKAGMGFNRIMQGKYGQQVKASDAEIDTMEVELETQCMRILALGSPVAHDLRFVLSVVRISGDFERIADLSRGIAKKVVRWSGGAGPTEVPGTLADMATSAQAMMADVLAALADEDAELCREVRRADRRVDDLNKEVIATSRQLIQDDPSLAAEAIDIMQIAQRIERIADITTNIAEDVIVLVEGRVVRHGD
jgi:phosphate transport system protein